MCTGVTKQRGVGQTLTFGVDIQSRLNICSFMFFPFCFSFGLLV